MSLNPMDRSSLALLTDLYQLTMSNGYWSQAMTEHEAVFTLFFRNHPFEGGFTISCGLQQVIDYIRGFRFEDSDITYLESLVDPAGNRLLDPAFLQYLQRMKLRITLDAVPEGCVVFPREPLLRVRGPLIACQLLETPLLNLINMPTLVATKAARICLAAQGDPVSEFGLRRAQGVDAGVSASRAAYIGGCSSTSNLLAGKLFGIPVKGTHAHSWVMAFGDERRAFQAAADQSPDNCMLLVDTYDPLQGIRHAIEVGHRLQCAGHRLSGIRLDSGDLLVWSRLARRMLNDAGLRETAIVASGDLDEHVISALKRENAPIDIWGVGTRLSTGHPQSALGAVYKLSALRAPGCDWEPRAKRTADPAKASLAGLIRVRRMRQGAKLTGDILYDEQIGIGTDEGDELLQPILQEGVVVYTPPPLSDIRSQASASVDSLPAGCLDLRSPDEYPVRMDTQLETRQQHLMAALSDARCTGSA